MLLRRRDPVFSLTIRLADLADKVAEILRESGVELEQVLQTLDEERERNYAEHYLPPAE